MRFRKFAWGTVLAGLLAAACSGGGGTAPASVRTLAVAPPAANFGTLQLGAAATQSILVMNTGNASVTVTAATVSGTGFRLSGGGVPSTIVPGQTTTFTVECTPQTEAPLSGNLLLSSDASNSPAMIPFTGDAMTLPTHYVTLGWLPSTSLVVGYYVYRAEQAGGPYERLNSIPVTITGFTDITAGSGKTYFYVVTALSLEQVESASSNEVTSTLPAL